jgi:hypothetical protein
MTSPNTKRNEDKDSKDLYNTPIEALIAADDAGIFDKFSSYYDPCNGLGEISNFLKHQGSSVYTGDIFDYGDQNEVVNFFDVTTSPTQQCIVFNPPFKLTGQFIDHALSLCPNLIMFNRATVLETNDRSVKHAEKHWPLKEFYSFGNRVSCTKGVDRLPTANSVWYGWFVYECGYKGKPQMDWLFTKRAA